MYYPNNIEEICYEQEHIYKVLNEISANLPIYFQQYIDMEGGNNIAEDEISRLANALGATSKPKAKTKNPKIILERLLKEAIEDFESDRESYLEILHPDSLAEYKHDVGSFKNTVLRNQIPIIRKTLQNKAAEELDKYRIAFKDSDPGDLFNVANNIITLAEEWKNDWYDSTEFENINICDDLDYYDMDGEDCTAYGVIGGGIKSHFIYKLYPPMYPNRSRDATWALWYLTERKKFGCKQDSEFLMINVDEGTTQQNYFYPYGLFAFYALQIYLKLKVLFANHNVTIPIEYRFVAVDSFLSFVANQHRKEIEVLKQKSKNYHYDY